MKISAIDIRKHTFEKIFRGYDPDEVDAFLNSLSQEWERFSSENSLLKMQLDYAEKELSKLKDIESTLFRTLKSAEDVSRQIEKEANEMAEKRIEESKTTANALVAEAEERTAQVIRETEEKLKSFKEEFASEVRIQERDFRAIENFRDNLIVQLSSLANSTLETVERFEQKYDKESVLNKMDEIKQHISEIEIPRKPVFHQEKTEDELPEEVHIILDDEKPEVTFEVADHTEAIQEPELVENTAEETPQVQEAVTDQPARSAADEANEALAALHQTKAEELNKTAEKAREEAPAVNRPRVYESSQPAKGGGGSFFDQI
jgi:cell division initiation protein